MKIRSYKKVVAFATGVTLLTAPISSFAEKKEDNTNQPVHVQGQSNAEKLSVTDKQALKSIEESFKNVDGRGISSEDVTDKIDSATDNSKSSSKSFRSSSTINGVKYTKWIIPKGNSNIRPGYSMKPKYITIHETDNTNVGAGARNHAQYLYNQAVGNTDRAASWHYTVDDKEIYQHLPIDENGWHAGDGNGDGNRKSIAIEIAVNKDSDYNKSVENAQKLVAYLMNQTGISSSNVVKHQKWSGKNCPAIMISRGQWSSFIERANVFAKGNKPAELKKTIQINGIGVNVRSGAGTNHSVVRKAYKGEKLDVYEEKNGWLRVSEKEWVFYNASYIKYL
ncbi:N-acetylmuramoyl-L-alanine amidase [Bacillus cereus]|nr:N-acetylmuramoyl-L-alanine amidase [Bacillus cereus]